MNYFSKFLKNLSETLHPLNHLLRKDPRWNWCSACDKAFKKVKDALASSKVFVYYDPSLPIRVAADASSYSVGAVLSHTMPDGSEHPILLQEHCPQVRKITSK